MRREILHRRAWVLLAFLSGGPALAAELTWIRVFGGGLGHELPALLGVVSAFFLGLGVGAWLLDRLVSRSPRPGRWYGGLEVFSGLWIGLTLPLLGAANELARHLAGVDPGFARQALTALVVPLVVVGPPAAAMGGTLPALDRVVTPLLPDRRAVALLYGVNTAGAILGVVVPVFWLMPWAGFRLTLGAASAVQLLCGVMAWGLAGRAADIPRPEPGRVGASRPPGEARRGRLWLTAAVLGFLGIGYELLGVRVLAHTTENTVRTFAAALAVFLGGIAAGSGWERREGRSGRGIRLAGLLQGLVLMVVGELAWMMWVPGWLPGVRGVLGDWGGEVALAVSVFLPPAFLMGRVFSQVAQEARGTDGGVGRAMAWNTLGGALAGPVLVAGVLPVGGVKWALGLVALGYFALVPLRWGLRQAVAGAAALAALAMLPPTGRWLVVPPGGELLEHAEGRLASVAVVRTADGNRVLRVNNHFQQGGTATTEAARRHALIPLLLHPQPERALFLGVGTGITLGAAAAFPGLQVEGVELLPEVVASLPLFEPENLAPQRRANCRIAVTDARRFVRVSEETYDVVVGDLFHPAEDGAGFLYTRDHFSAVRDRLAEPGGLYCQWLPLHQLDLATFRDVATTFLEVFPTASLWLLRFNVDVPAVALIGGIEPLRIDAERLDARCRREPLAPLAAAAGVGDALRLLGCRLADTTSLRGLARGGDVATDDWPVVLFRAASSVYREPRVGEPGRRLLALIDGATPGYAELLRTPEPERWVPRLEGFRVARDRHLHGLAAATQGRQDEALSDYLGSVRASPDYTAGYAQAILVASAYAHEDPAKARRILEALLAERPKERLAQALLQRLDAASRGSESRP